MFFLFHSINFSVLNGKQFRLRFQYLWLMSLDHPWSLCRTELPTGHDNLLSLYADDVVLLSWNLIRLQQWISLLFSSRTFKGNLVFKKTSVETDSLCLIKIVSLGFLFIFLNIFLKKNVCVEEDSLCLIKGINLGSDDLFGSYISRSLGHICKSRSLRISK